MIKEIKYKKEDVYRLMGRICDEYGIRLRIVDERREAEELGWSFNCGACSGDFIMISYFTYGRQCLERKLIAFFHEFAHCRLADLVPFRIDGYGLNHMSMMQYEMAVSYLGIKFAKEKYDIVFSDDAVKWLLKENMTYSNSKSGESCKFIRGNNKVNLIRQEIIDVE